MGLFTSKKSRPAPATPETPPGALPTDARAPSGPRGHVADQLAIRELIGRFACGIDFRDWDAFANLFTATVSVRLDPRTSGSPPVAVPTAAWQKFAAASFAAYDSTHHQVTLDYVDFDGDEARAVSHFTASHHLANPDGAPTFVQKGTYVHACVRTEEGWRISGWEQDVRWGNGNRAVLDMAMGEMPGELVDLIG